ncbi:unnamed protein product, partial [Allacma fusca]
MSSVSRVVEALERVGLLTMSIIIPWERSPRNDLRLYQASCHDKADHYHELLRLLWKEFNHFVKNGHVLKCTEWTYPHQLQQQQQQYGHPMGTLSNPLINIPEGFRPNIGLSRDEMKDKLAESLAQDSNISCLPGFKP